MFYEKHPFLKLNYGCFFSFTKKTLLLWSNVILKIWQ